MDKVISSLNFMQRMERFATKVYQTQVRAFSRHEITDRLKAAAANEQEHADMFTKRVEELKGTPSKMGIFFQIAGAILGFTTTLLGKALLLKTNILIEKQAVRDYGGFLQRVELDETSVALINKIIGDEKKHIETWDNCIRMLKGKP